MVLLKAKLDEVPHNCLECPYCEQMDSRCLEVNCLPESKELTDKVWSETLQYYYLVKRPDWCPLIEE